MATGTFLIQDAIPAEAITLRPNIFLSVFKDEAALKQFLETFDWFVQKIKTS